MFSLSGINVNATEGPNVFEGNKVTRTNAEKFVETRITEAEALNNIAKYEKISVMEAKRNVEKSKESFSNSTVKSFASNEYWVNYKRNNGAIEYGFTAKIYSSGSFRNYIYVGGAYTKSYGWQTYSSHQAQITKVSASRAEFYSFGYLNSAMYRWYDTFNLY